MAEEITFAKKNGSQNFRIHTASTKVTQSELAELERAAAERGIRLSEWIREVLFREFVTVTRCTPVTTSTTESDC